jgi:hypothetical protein
MRGMDVEGELRALIRRATIERDKLDREIRRLESFLESGHSPRPTPPKRKAAKRVSGKRSKKYETRTMVVGLMDDGESRGITAAARTLGKSRDAISPVFRALEDEGFLEQPVPRGPYRKKQRTNQASQNGLEDWEAGGVQSQLVAQ